MADQKMNITIKAFDKTKKGFGSVTKGISRVAGAALNLKTALIGTAGIAGMGLLIKSSLDATDSLGKTARKIGVTTESLASMRYAAKLTGVETATMDMALQRFTRRAAEAAMGTGEAKDALKELGLNASDLIKMPLEEQMGDLAGAFDNVATDADKVRLAMKLFDSEGVALVNTLGLGKEGLFQMAAEAEELGIALKGSTVAGVEAANDSLTRMQMAFKGVRDQTVAALAPALGHLADFIKKEFLASIKASGGSVEKFAKNMAVTVLESVRAVIEGFARMANMIDKTLFTINEKFRQINASAAQSEIKGLYRELETLGRAEKAYESGGAPSYKTRFKLMAMSVDRDGKSVTNAIQAKNQQIQNLMNKLFSGDLKPTGGYKELFDLDGFNEVMDALVAKVNSAVPAVIEGLNPLREGFKASADAVEQAFKAMESTSGSVMMSILGSVQGILNGLMSATEKGSSKYKTLFAISKGVAVAQAIVGANLAGASTLAAYATAAPTVALAGPEALMAWNAKGAKMASLATALGYANAAVIAGTAVSSYDGGGFTGHGSRSGGVDGKGGFNAILHPNETVIDHTKGQGQGIVVNQTINVTTGVQNTVRAEIQNLMPQIAENAKAAVAVANQRGGAYSRMFS